MEGVRVCGQPHDARTASEHLAPSSILGSENRLKVNGVRVREHSNPDQRQLMHTASVSTYDAEVARRGGGINHMWWPAASFLQNL